MMGECLGLDENELRDCVGIDFANLVGRGIVIDDVVDGEEGNLGEWGAFEYD